MPKVVEKPKTKLGAKLAEKVRPKQTESLWKGPEIDGITQSMLSNFLVCRERFRVKYVEGLRPHDQFNKGLEYGQLWHTCEEALAKEPEGVRATNCWQTPLKEYAQSLVKRYPLAGEQIDQWYNVCKVQFPLYVSWWSKHPDVQKRTPLFQEQVFNIPYRLPSGRVVRLRGKFDAVDLIGKDKTAGIYLQENKTKGDINEQQLQRQLSFDLQTMLYLVALQEMLNQPDEAYVADEFQSPIRGVRYNVIRRPLSGGKGSIRQHAPTKSNPQGESKADYYARLGTIIEEANGPAADLPEGQHYFFMRWKAEISATDIERFKTRFLNPILEQLCLWYDWIENNPDPFNSDYVKQSIGIHFQYPFGTYNPLTDGGGATDVDEYLLSGNKTGLERAESLFGELQ